MSISPFLAVDTEAFGGMIESLVKSLGFFTVEIQVIIAALVIFLLDLAIPERFSKQLAWVAIAGCLIPAYSMTGHHIHPEDSRLFLGMLSFDSFSNFFKMFFLLGSVPVILMTYESAAFEGRRMGEYYGILLCAVFGAMLMASSTHFLMMFLALELVSLASYVLVGYRRRDHKGVEAAMKYLIYGTVAAGIMIFGMSLYYGLTGSADVADAADILRGQVASEMSQGRLAAMAIVSFLLIFVGIAYKISSIPMHFWAPDAYEGAPTPVTAFLAVLSKAAGIALALRLFHSLLEAIHLLPPDNGSAKIWHDFIGAPNGAPWLLIIMAIAIATMTIGNLAALWQNNLKRMFAYSSIAHAGYMMMGLTLLDPAADLEINGVNAITYYLLAYLGMNFGAFAIVMLVENKTGNAEISGFSGLGRRAPFLAAAMVVFLFSLIGLPPTAGFTGKLQLFMGVVETGRTEFFVLAIAAAINTAISAYYYLRVAKEMYFTESTDTSEIPCSGVGKFLVVAMVFLTFYLFFAAEGILETTKGLELEL